MFLSKIWFILVALLAGIATTAAFVAPRPADRQIEQLEGQRLDRAQYAAEQMLKTDAHRWIDYVAKLGRDAVLAESLDSASRGAGEPRMLNETVKGRLRSLIPDLAGIGLGVVGAVDAKGRVVARAGDRETEMGDSLAGAEVIADALRGYLSDDVWAAGGKVMRIAAAPVLSKTRDRIVGVIFVGAETGKRLAELWRKNLVLDVAILMKNQVLSSTMPEALLGGLPEQIAQHRKEIVESKRTRAIVLPVGSDRLLAVAAPFTGQASQQEAYYVLIGKKAPPSNPFALLSSTAADDLSWRRFPWLGLGGGLAVMLAVGLFLQRREVENPLGRLRRDVQRLARGEMAKLDDRQFPGQFGGIARDVNAAMDKLAHATPSRESTSRADLNAILDGRESSSPFSSAPSLSNSSSTSGSAMFKAPMIEPPPAVFASPPSTLSAPPDWGTGPQRTPTPVSNTPPPRPVPPSLSGAPSPFVAAAARPTPSPFAPPPPPAARPPAPPPRPSPLPARAAPRPTGSVDVSTSFTDEIDNDHTTRMPISDEKTRTLDPVDNEEAHIREVYAEYVAARHRTGEAVGSLTLDKFRSRLDGNRQQLIAKYNCRTARFSVYIKDGKAAIKATPVRD